MEINLATSGHFGNSLTVSGAGQTVVGKLQMYVCHDGTLEVYVDGKDIKELLGIDTSSMWFDFGLMALAVASNPGKETDARPKDFGEQPEILDGLEMPF